MPIKKKVGYMRSLILAWTIFMLMVFVLHVILSKWCEACQHWVIKHSWAFQVLALLRIWIIY
jgi:hypothetical protein